MCVKLNFFEIMFVLQTRRIDHIHDSLPNKTSNGYYFLIRQARKYI